MRGDRLEGLVVEAIDPEAWERAWGEQLKPFDAALKSCVAQLDAAGARCTVFHYGPESVAEIFSCPTRGSSAVMAARLALADQAGIDAAFNPTQVIPIAHDKVGTPRQSHLLMAADRNVSANAIESWVRRAGLMLENTAPAEAGHLAWLARRMIKLDDPSPRILMWLGSHRSALAVGGGGRLSLVRRLDIGVESLISALCATSLTQGTACKLSRDEARKLINTIGIPEPKADVDAARGLKGFHLLPLLQPILQKCIVELKQSIRFGLEEQERSSAKLSIVGPGAAVARLGQVLSEQTEVELDPLAGLDDEQSDLNVALRGLPAGFSLISLEAAHDAGFRTIRRAMWGGGIAAVIAAAALGGHAVMEASRAGERLGQMRSELSQLEALKMERESGDAEIATIERVLTAGDEVLGEAPRYSDFLRELTIITPENVRLTDISYTRSAGVERTGVAASNRVELRGYAASGVDGASPDLSAYIQALSGSPLVASVALGTTERSFMDERPSLRFSLTLVLVDTIANPARQASAAVGGQP